MKNIELTKDQTIYLLYAKAYYDEKNSITKGAVKSHLPKEWKAEEIYNYLKNKNLIEPISNKGKFSLTADGYKTLLENLITTGYEFTSIKGAKVLNTLLACLKDVAEQIEISEPVEKEMPYEEFEQKFEAAYREERRCQELKGQVCIRSKEICEEFAEQYRLPVNMVNRLFKRLKSDGKIKTVMENKRELMAWVE